MMLIGDPTQLTVLRFNSLQERVNTFNNLLGTAVEDIEIINPWGIETALAVLENMTTVCDYRQRDCAHPAAVKIWEVRILSILFAIEWLYGLEDTYELHL